jgi:hypothetical protein
MVGQLLPAHAAATAELLPDGAGQLTLGLDLADILRQPAAGAQLERGLALLVHHPRAAELVAAIKQTSDILAAFPDALAAVTAPDALGKTGEIDLGEPARLARDVHARTERWIKLAAALSAGEDPAQALDGFLADWTLVP